MMVTFGFWNASQEAANRLPAEGRMQITAFISGINDYIISHPNNLTVEFTTFDYTPELFAVADMILMVKFMSLQLCSNYLNELFRLNEEYGVGLSREQIDSLFPKYPNNAPTTLHREDVQKMGHFSHTFEPLPPPRFASPVNHHHRQEAEQETAFTPPTPRLTIPELLNPKGFLAWTSHPMFTYPASNSWTVSGKRTVSGKPLLMNDPHLSLTFPSIWIIFSLSCPTLNVTGGTIVGLFGITSGRNDRISWGLTNVGSDVQDLFKLQLGRQGKTYIHNGQEYNFVNRTETIKVRGGDDIVLTIRETLYGPVISDTVDTFGLTLALQWTSLYHADDQTALTFIPLNKARNFQEFRNALDTYFLAPSQNFMFADIDGNIGYQCPGKIPVRKNGNGEYFAEGNGNYDWIGYIKFNELPYIYNPDRGYIANANNKIVPNNYPYLITNDRDWLTKYRVSRIEQLILATRKHTVQTMIAVQNDQVTASWFDMKPILQDTITSRLDNTAKYWKRQLLNWNGYTGPNDQRPTVFEFWMYELGRIGNFSGYGHAYDPFYLYTTFTSAHHRLDRYATDAFQRTVDNLLVMFNGTIPLWGDAQTLTIAHPLLSTTPLAPLADRSMRRGGDCVTINVANPNANGLFTTDDVVNPYAAIGFGPSYRHIIDTQHKNMDLHSIFSLPGGESGDIYSPFYANILPLWENGQYLPLRIHTYNTISTEVVHD